jgi:FixJ family two-component response regulator
MPTDSVLVAVVDDEESVLKALERLIRSAGFDVRAFSSGIEFLRSLPQRAPHCVVLDLHMPHLSGFLVQDALKRSCWDIPVVIMTGDDSQESRTQALDQGAAAYLRKPVDDVVLLDAIQSALRANRADDERQGSSQSA